MGNLIPCSSLFQFVSGPPPSRNPEEKFDEDEEQMSDRLTDRSTAAIPSERPLWMGMGLPPSSFPIAVCQSSSAPGRPIPVTPLVSRERERESPHPQAALLADGRR